MKNLFYLLFGFMLLIAYVQYESKDSMAAIQAKNFAVGTAMAAKWNKKGRCEIVYHNGIELRICG